MNLAERITAWAERDASVKAVVLFGSRVRAPNDGLWQADAHSDWDFQIISSRPEMFVSTDWTKNLGLAPHTYAVRRAAIGGVPKIAAIFADAEMDLIIVSAVRFQRYRWLVKLGVHRRSGRLQRILRDLAVVVRPGWRFLKGAAEWEPFYQRVVADIGDPRLGDDEARNLANGFVCDARWTLRKIERGEFVAAQRMLHRSLLETNFQLLHELRLRRGQRSFPEGRRLERVCSETEIAGFAVVSRPDPQELRAAVGKCSDICRSMMTVLVGTAWRWPDQES